MVFYKVMGIAALSLCAGLAQASCTVDNIQSDLAAAGGKAPLSSAGNALVAQLSNTLAACDHYNACNKVEALTASGEAYTISAQCGCHGIRTVSKEKIYAYTNAPQAAYGCK